MTWLLVIAVLVGLPQVMGGVAAYLLRRWMPRRASWPAGAAGAFAMGWCALLWPASDRAEVGDGVYRCGLGEALWFFGLVCLTPINAAVGLALASLLALIRRTRAFPQ